MSAGLSFALAACLVASPAGAVEAYLRQRGDQGPLSIAEQELIDLRFQEEARAQRELNQLRERGEAESKESQVGLCATPFGVDVVGITETVALIGATVSGISARLRKQELEKLNEQLRQVNQQLRQQARVGTLYAPGLSYAPSHTVAASAVVTVPPEATAEAWQPLAPSTAGGSSAGAASAALVDASLDEPLDECRAALREGKRLLKDGNGPSALVRFEKAHLLSRANGNKVQERRALRGLAASHKIMGNYKKAITYLEKVLEVSNTMDDHLGDADAYGVIADCYTLLNDYEMAAKFYDRYIEAMAKDGPV